MIVRLIQFFANNIVLTLKIRLCLYEMAINYILSLVFFALFSSQSDLVFLPFLFFIYKNVYPKYCQGYEKDVSQ